MNQVVVPHEIVNDESVTLVEWLTADGQEVRAGQVVARLESSKGVIDIEAPEAGWLRHQARAGQDLAIGAPLCAITLSPEEKLPEAVASPPPDQSSAPPPPLPARANREPSSPGPAPSPSSPAAPDTSAPASSRFSKAALELLRAKGLDPKAFANRGLVTASDILETLGLASNPPAHGGATLARSPDISAVGAQPLPEGVRYRSEELTRAKRAEVQYLGAAQNAVLPSVVGVLCETSGFREAFARPGAAGTSALAVIIAETARLLRQHPALNAFFRDGKIHYYEEINIGFALDAGFGLKVPVIRGADAKSAPEIEAEIKDFVFNYLEKSLPVAAMAGGTFTVTDLSGEGAFSIHPLINQWQGAILAIGAEFKPASAAGGFYQLLLAFDHQLTEGRAASAFLQNLRDRLAAYERALAVPPPEAPESVVECSHCRRTGQEIEGLRAFLLHRVESSGARSLICSLCLAGY